MITPQRHDAWAILLLEVQQRLADSDGVLTTIDVVSQEDQRIPHGRLDVFEQEAQQRDLPVQVTNGEGTPVHPALPCDLPPHF